MHTHVQITMGPEESGRLTSPQEVALAVRRALDATAEDSITVQVSVSDTATLGGQLASASPSLSEDEPTLSA